MMGTKRKDSPKRLCRIEADDGGILLNLFGQEFIERIYEPDRYTDKEWMRIFGLKLKGLGSMVLNVAESDKYSEITIRGEKCIYLGFTPEGSVINKEADNES